MVSSLRHKNFRLYLSGQLVSQIGTWMQQLAISWLVYRLTNSTFWLGVTTFLSQVPNFILGLMAGVLVDRTDRIRLLKWTQALSAIQALILALLTLTGRITLFEILFLSGCLGIINAIDIPTRQALVAEVIDDKRDLANAIALNSSVMNGSRLIGPALAGLVIIAGGEGVCFLLNSVSYLAVLIALTLMTVTSSPHVSQQESIIESIDQGVRFAFGCYPIRNILLLLAILSLIGSPFMILLPVLADKTLHGNATTLSLLTTATGSGAFFAALVLATRKNHINLNYFIGGCALGFSIALLLLSLANHVWIALFVLFLVGFGMMSQMASSNILIQTVVEDNKRGRVMALFTLSLVGVAPFGNLLVGSLAEKVGLVHTLMICGSIYLLFSLWFLAHLNRMNQELCIWYERSK